MTTPYLFGDIKRDEGCRLAAYPDPLSGGDPWTIGYGHTGREVQKGLDWTQAQADDQLSIDIGAVQRRMDQALPWWRKLSDPRQDVLVNMGFNMGVEGLTAFHHMLAAIQEQDWTSAHDAMVDSLWARQVHDRAQRLARQLYTGMRE